jgi:tetratricopeptide (TPR) repeat protein
LSDYRYKAFISYCHADERWARWLQQALESYRVPRHLVSRHQESPAPRRLAPIFRDRDELAAASSLTDRIQTALEQSDYLVVLCSRSAAQSRWVEQEIRQFQSLGRPGRILCCMVDLDLPPGQPLRQCFPSALLQAPVGRGEEPLAADIRPFADGRRLAKLKLAAAMLDVGLDALVQRDLRRRRRWKLVWSAAAVAVLLLVAVTVKSRLDQVRTKQRNEDLAGMIVDLGAKARSNLNLELRAQFSANILSHFSDLDPDSLSVGLAIQVAKTLIEAGEVHRLQGRPEQALDAFVQSRNMLKRLVEDEPNHWALQYQLGQAHFYIGSLFVDERRHQEAEMAMDRYGRSASILYELQPENPGSVLEMSYALISQVGLRIRSRGGIDPDTVEKAERAVDLMKRARRDFPTDGEIESNYSTTLAWLADAYDRSCDLQRALNVRKHALDLAEEASRSEPMNLDLKKVVAQRKTGVRRLQFHLGHLSQAEKQLVDAIALNTELATLDPSNQEHHDDVRYLTKRKAYMLAETGRLDAARKILSQQDLNDPNGLSPATVELNAGAIDNELIFADAHLQAGDAETSKQSLLRVREHVEHNEEAVEQRWTMKTRLERLRYLWWRMSGEDIRRYLPEVVGHGLDHPRAFRSCRETEAVAWGAVIDKDLVLAKAEVEHLESRGYASPAFVSFCRLEGICGH